MQLLTSNRIWRPTAGSFELYGNPKMGRKPSCRAGSWKILPRSARTNRPVRPGRDLEREGPAPR